LENLPNVYLFSGSLAELDWFGWGDILYFSASISSVIQAFFPLVGISDDFSSCYYLICKWKFVLVYLFSFIFLRSEIANSVFLLDSIIYLVAYLFYLKDLRSSLFTGMIPATRTVSLRFVKSLILFFFAVIFNISFSQIIAEEEAIIAHRESDHLLAACALDSSSLGMADEESITADHNNYTYQNVSARMTNQVPFTSSLKLPTTEEGYVNMSDIQEKMKNFPFLRRRKKKSDSFFPHSVSTPSVHATVELSAIKKPGLNYHSFTNLAQHHSLLPGVNPNHSPSKINASSFVTNTPFSASSSTPSASSTASKNNHQNGSPSFHFTPAAPVPTTRCRFHSSPPDLIVDNSTSQDLYRRHYQSSTIDDDEYDGNNNNHNQNSGVDHQRQQNTPEGKQPPFPARLISSLTSPAPSTGMMDKNAKNKPYSYMGAGLDDNHGFWF
jgi:hypothetical protein